MQRILDIIFSGLALVLLSPIFAFVVVILKFTGEGEVLFIQTRVGRFRNSIQLLKFATMVKNSPNLGTGTITIKGDPRVLPFGKLLRKTKINELPQLINIFKGDMSIIGPRPQTQRCFDAFPHIYQENIVKVRPGLSGIGSVIFRNEEEILQTTNDAYHLYDKVIMPFKGELEEWYVKNQNLNIYLALILITVWIVIKPKSKVAWRLFKELPKPPVELNPYI